MRTKQGFVLIELIVVLALFGALIGMSSINLLGARNSATISATLDGVTSDLSSQQTKAMSSTTSGSGAMPYGVRFESDRYILFHGSVYKSADPTNSVVPLSGGTKFSVINLPDYSIIFASQSGAVVGYNPSAASVTVYQPNNFVSKTISINQYGVVTSVQ
jgi:prepilin-type N-terminal cleavage/methylation domain-containing protein